LKAVAHTLPYDTAIVGEYQTGEPLPADRWASVEIASLVVVGGKSPVWFHHGAQALADAFPHADLRVLDGQTHNVKAKALAPLLTEFFRGETTAAEKPGEPVTSGSRS
jgi:pimeloyl-ACP methyl ester carboxylesterase